MSNLNPKLNERLQRRQKMSPEEYVKRILAGDRVTLSKAITLIESTRAEHQEIAQSILSKCIPHAGKSFRIGITGTPGVGKSTFIEAIGQHLIKQKKKVAVLAVDPSSPLSKGSILGDKTRMGQLSSEANAFIRPSPAGDSLGGVARKTRETIILCEAAGFDTILLETVGVGQSEVAVHAMTDFFLLLLLPGAGDELQGIKRGIVEMADMIVVNKADGDRIPLAKQAQREYRRALHLYPLKKSGWQPEVSLCSALQKEGIEHIWARLLDFETTTKKNQYFEKNRQDQALYWLHETIDQQLKKLLYQQSIVQEALPQIEKDVQTELLTPFQGAEQLMQLFQDILKKQ